MLKKVRFYIIIILLVFFQYGNTLEHDYAWDDAIVITQNERVQEGLSDPSEYFRNIKSDQIQHRYGYRPISLLSFGLDVELSEMTPKTSHVMNVLYYALLCCLIFSFLRRMFPEKGALFSAIIVGLFIIHPVHTEVVANIKSRDEILAMLFGVSSMIFFLQFLEKESRKLLYALLSVFALVLSFLSKENGFTFVGILLLIAYFKSTTTVKPYVKYLLPILGALVLFGIRTYVYSPGFFEDLTSELIKTSQFKEDGFLGNPLTAASGFMEILPNVFNILIKDLGLLFFPLHLVHDYGYSHSTMVGWGEPLVILSILIHLFLIYLLIREFKRKSALLFGILFYFITLSVFLHIIQVGPDYMGERFLFIPSLGFIIAIIAAIERITNVGFNAEGESIWKSAKAKIALGILAIFFILGFVKTFNRNKAWENNTTLLEADIEKLDDCARTQYNYAVHLHNEYYKHPREDKQAKILYHYQRAVDITKRKMNVMLDLGKAYMEFGQAEKGKALFEEAAEIHKDMVAPPIMLGQYYISKEEYKLALKSFEQAEDISKIPNVYHWKAVTYLKMNQMDKALKSMEEGEQYKPTEAGYYDVMADLYLSKKDYEKARRALENALKFNPNDQNLLKKLSDLPSIP